VADCAVFGVPDEVAGEAIVALIQPTADAPPERECKAAIRRRLAEHLSAIKHPRYLELVRELPRDAIRSACHRARTAVLRPILLGRTPAC
jgi:long-chain acyl-CoA synthetase